MSDTPRVDAFVQALPPFRVKDETPGFEVVQQVRELMTAWGTFARDLEREIGKTVPEEWTRDRVLDVKARAMLEWQAHHHEPLTAHERALFHFAFDAGNGKLEKENDDGKSQ